MQFKHVFLILIVLFNFWMPCLAQEPTILEHGAPVSSVVFSPVNPNLVASAGGHNVVKIWNLRNNTVKTLTGHTEVVNSVAFSPDGKWLVSGSEDATIKVWDVSQWQNIETRKPITFRMPSPIPQVVFSPAEPLLATAGGGVQLLDIGNQTEVAIFEPDEWAWTIAFSGDGKYLATTTHGTATVNIWDIQEKQIMTTLEGPTEGMNSVKFSPDNRTFVASSWGGEIKLWAVSNWELLGTLQTGGTAAVDFSPDEKILASAGWETVTLWSAENGEHLATLTGHTGGEWIRGLAFSPDGRTLATGGGDGTVHIWNIDAYLQSQQHAGIVRLIYFLPSDRTPQPDIDAKMDALIKEAQLAYAEILERHGFGRKTFKYETDANGKAVVHHVKGKFKDSYYDVEAERVWEEIYEQFDTLNNIYLTALDVKSEDIRTKVFKDGQVCGLGAETGSHSGDALLPASGDCFNVDVVAHELGHAFGMRHDYRTNPKRVLSSHTGDKMIRTFCAAEWLDVHSYFNTHETGFNEPTTIEMLAPQTVLPDAIRLRFEVTDPDGLHQAQLLTPEFEQTGGLIACQRLKGTSSTVEFVVSKTIFRHSGEVQLLVMDQQGSFSVESFYADPQAGPKIEGPWVWMIVPTGVDGSAAATSGIDYLAEASGGAVTEKQIATKGATAGEAVGDKVWTLGRIAPTGGDNITELVNAIGLGEGNIDHHVAYGSIVLDAPRTQKTTMHVGSDDAVKVWLNGVLVHDNPVNRGAKDYQENFPVTLKQGKNILLVAVYESGVYWSGFFGFDKGTEYTLQLSPLALLSASERPSMSWVNTQHGTLHRLVADIVENLVPGVQNAARLAIDVADGKIYWTEQTSKKTGKIRRSDFNGSNVRLVKDLTSLPLDIAIDTVNRKLYVANALGKIQRLNLDGSNFQPNLITGLKTPTGIAIDPQGGKLYWIEQTSDKAGKIRRSDFNGSNVRLVKDLTSQPLDIAIDTVNRKFYVANALGKIQRMNPDGSDFQPNFITDLEVPRGIAVSGDKVYWTEQGSIRRADFNGQNIEDVVVGLGAPVSLALGIVPAGAKVPAAPATLAVDPVQTVLLANYPNPFNPETWIPYQLAHPADVTLRIYAVDGSLVRTLSLGHQAAGVYQTRSRAAYWDGRNAQGEPVASGVYFYTLSTESTRDSVTVGDFTATRKMLIQK